MIIVRELTGGIYYGTPRGSRQRSRRARHQHDDLHPRRNRARHPDGFSSRPQPAQELTSVDKSNVLETSQLWRKVVTDTRA